MGQETNQDSLANPFLEGVADTDREIVGKYIKDWDSQVTKKFQDIHNQYKPYKDLGADPEVLQAGLSVLYRIQTDPQGALTEIKEALEELMAEENDNQPVGGSVADFPEFENLTPQQQEFFKGMQAKADKFEKFMETQMTAQQEQQEMAQLDKAIKDLHTEQADFDEEFVVALIATGHSPKEALAKYNAMSERISSQKSAPAPKILSGGSTPNDQVDLSKIKNSKDRKALVEKILEQSQR